MASKRTLVFLCVVIFVILVFCASESESRRGRRGYRSSFRSSRRYGSSNVGGGISRGSSTYRYSGSAWRAAASSGAIYGGNRYMQSSYYREHPDRMPTICTNNYETASNGRIYGHFICPRETEPANYTRCCGTSDNEFCCDGY